MWAIRSFYYLIVDKLSDSKQYRHLTGFGLYDKKFIKILRNLNDAIPSMRGFIAEFGTNVVTIPFKKPMRHSGKTKNNFFTLFDVAMINITTYTKTGLRIALILGTITALISFLVGIVYLILKLIYWNSFPAGVAPILIWSFFIGAVQLIFIGFLGEYLMIINQRLRNRPLVIEQERVNFLDKTEQSQNP
jgi:hypothetical protein